MKSEWSQILTLKSALYVEYIPVKWFIIVFWLHNKTRDRYKRWKIKYGIRKISTESL